MVGAPVGIRGRDSPTHSTRALPQPLRLGSGLSPGQVPRKWPQSLWSGCAYHMSPVGTSGSERQARGGGFSSIWPAGWKTTTPGGVGLGAALGLAVGVAWWPEGTLGCPVRGSRDRCLPALRAQLLQSPLPGLGPPSVQGRTVVICLPVPGRRPQGGEGPIPQDRHKARPCPSVMLPYSKKCVLLPYHGFSYPRSTVVQKY